MPRLCLILLLLCGLGLPAGAERIKLKDLPHEEDPQEKREKREKAAEPLVEDVAEELYQKGLNALNADQLDQAEGYFDRALVLNPKHQGARDGIDLIMKMLEEPVKPVVVATPDPKIKLMEALKQKLDAQIKEGNWEDANETLAKIRAINPAEDTLKAKTTLVRKKLAALAVERARERELKDDYTGAIDAYKVAANYANDPAFTEKINQLRAKIAAQKLKQAEELYVQALNANQQGKFDEAMELCKKALLLDPQHFSAQRMLDRLQSRTPR